MPTFTCLEPIEHDQQRYEPPSEITLSDEAAAPLLAIGHIAAVAVAAAKTVTRAGKPVKTDAGGEPAPGNG